MKILYAIQTQGNGHLSRAQKLVPEFIKKARVDILTSGPSNNFPTYKTPIKHYKGFKFFTSKFLSLESNEIRINIVFSFMLSKSE